MKWLQICALLVATLVAMRLGSWAIGWALAKLARLRPKAVAIIANSLGFGAFAFLLVRDLAPGEPVDYAALLFGIVVFAICCFTDFYWSPWRRSA
jgi:predicted permease